MLFLDVRIFIRASYITIKFFGGHNAYRFNGNPFDLKYSAHREYSSSDK